MPGVGPVHHSEKCEDRHARVQLPGHSGAAHLLENSQRDFYVSPFHFQHFLAEDAFERFVFVGENLHFQRVLQKIIQMVVNQYTQLLDWTRSPGQLLFQAGDDRFERVNLNQVQELLLALNVVIEAGQRYSAGTADVADGSAFVTLVTENLRGMPQNYLKL